MATVSAVLYTSKKYANDTHPIMIKVQHRGSRKYFKCGDETYNVTKNQWDKKEKELKRDRRLNKNYVDQNFYIQKQVKKINEIIDGFEKKQLAWTFNLLEQRLLGNANYINFKSFTESLINKFNEQKRYGTVDNYKDLVSVLIKILGEKKYNKLEIADIDYAFCEKIIAYGREETYTNGMVRQRWKESFLQARLKQIRAILNEAIKQDVGSPATYPFSDKYGAKKYIRINEFKAKNKRNKYVPSDFMQRFIDYKPYKLEQMIYIKSHIFWCLLGEISFPQMIELRKSAIQEMETDGEMQKVILLPKGENEQHTVVPITTKMQILLDWFEKYTLSADDYIFPIIDRIEARRSSEECNHRDRRCRLIQRLMAKNKLPECCEETFDQWNAIEELIPLEALTQKIFLFSYYAQGINPRDMAMLRKSSIQNNFDSEQGDYRFFTYNRQKVKYTTGAVIEVQISDNIQNLLDWFEKNMPPVDDYLLPIVSKPHLTGKKYYDHVSYHIKRINQSLKTIAEKCGFPDEIKDLYMYCARHTYARTMRKNGAPIEVISESLGHTDLRTTKIYLDTFGHKEINKYNVML